MSEAERRRRLNYKKNRKKMIFAQAIAMAAVALFIAIFVMTYIRLDKTYYIDYSESGAVDYKVQYLPNDFYDAEWQPSGQSYVTALVQSMKADFKYNLNMGTEDVDYRYTYRIDAEVKIVDKSYNNKTILSEKYELKGNTTSLVSSNNRLTINETVDVDFPTYNALAKAYVKTYDLTNVTANLVVTMTVNVTGSSNEFVADSNNSRVITLNVPLNQKTIEAVSVGNADSENKVLAYTDAGNRDVYKTLSIIFSGILFAMLLVFVGFVYLTRNHDVNYSIKVQKLVSSYRSFIQEIINGFDVKGYQVLMVKSFEQMLGIRDTIQSPILMSENTDQTRTQFFIPTNTKILYLYEIKVDNYDEIYGEHPEYVDDSVVSDDIITARTVAEATPAVVNEATERVVGIVTGKLDEAITAATPEIVRSTVTAATPEIVRSAVSEANALIDKRISEIPATVTVHEQTDATADAIAAKLIQRLAAADSAEKPEPVINLSISPKIETPEPVVNLTVTPAEPVVHLTVNPVIEREHVEEKTVVQSAPVVITTETDTDVHEPTPEREKKVYEEIVIARGIAEGEREVITVTPVSDDDEPIAVPFETPVPMPEKVIENAPIPTPVSTETTSEPVSEVSDDADEDGECDFIIDENGNRLSVRVSRSFTANIIQSDPASVKLYYSELKNYILSYKNVKARMAWRYETFKKGKYQLFRMKIRGKTVCLYCALDPNEFDENKYFHEASDTKMFENVPMLVKIRSDRGLKRAKELIDITMSRFELKPDPKAHSVDYIAEHPYESTVALISRGLIKVLNADFAPNPDRAEEKLAAAIDEAMATPDVVLEDVDYVKEEIVEYRETEDKPGVEVVGVVWRERDHGNRIYRYDPNGEVLHDGDVVLVPTKSSSKETVRKAAVAEGNHKVDPDTVKSPLKKIISVVKRRVEDILSGS